MQAIIICEYGSFTKFISLFVSLLNQFTGTSTFISNGIIVAIDTKTFELQSENLIAKIFCGFADWFGHIRSD
ncbi:hypothetical protein NHP164001_06100 [Helicobacter trogontum]|uniref:Uncharacterized protein n=1 Tax=Helicobacter trogontum TaxID=50960 RepID=A0ABQ0D2Q1_9HELI